MRKRAGGLEVGMVPHPWFVRVRFLTFPILGVVPRTIFESNTY